MRTSHFVVASIFLAAGIAGLMTAGLKPAWDFNPMSSIGHSFTSSPVAVARVLQIADRSITLSDPEAGGDMADAEEAVLTFKARWPVPTKVSLKAEGK